MYLIDGILPLHAVVHRNNLGDTRGRCFTFSNFVLERDEYGTRHRLRLREAILPVNHRCVKCNTSQSQRLGREEAKRESEDVFDLNVY